MPSYFIRPNKTKTIEPERVSKNRWRSDLGGHRNDARLELRDKLSEWGIRHSLAQGGRLLRIPLHGNDEPFAKITARLNELREPSAPDTLTPLEAIRGLAQAAQLSPKHELHFNLVQGNRPEIRVRFDPAKRPR